tara:strand:- start:12498 stop:15023 length:2526 start_codon:yes stop_codon:yes gene_type:complete
MFNSASQRQLFVEKYESNFSIESYNYFFGTNEFKKDLGDLDKFLVFQINSIFKEEYKSNFEINDLKEIIINSDIAKKINVSVDINAKIDIILRANKLWQQQLNQDVVQEQELAVDERQKTFDVIRQTYVFNKKLALDELVRKLSSVYQEDAHDTGGTKEFKNFHDIDFTALISKIDIQTIEQNLKLYLQEIEKYRGYFNSCAKHLGMEYKLDDTTYLVNEARERNYGLEGFIVDILKWLFKLFKSDDEKLNILTTEDKYTVTESLWNIVKITKEINEDPSKAAAEFFNSPYQELLGDTLRLGFNEKAQDMERDVVLDLRNSYNWYHGTPGFVSITYLYFKNHPIELTPDSLPRITEVVTSIVEPFLESRYAELISIAKKHIEYNVDKFIFELNNMPDNESRALDNCGKILDLIEKTNDDIEVALFNTRFAIVEEVLNICNLNSKVENELFTNIVNEIDKIVLNTDDVFRKGLQGELFDLLNIQVNLAIESNDAKPYQTVKLMLATNEEFIKDNFLQKLKQQAKLIAACSPTKELTWIYDNGDEDYWSRFHLDTKFVLEMNQLISPISDKYREDDGLGFERRHAGYGSTNTVGFSSFALYRAIIEMQENKTLKQILHLLARNYNYDADPAKSYFAIKITKWRDALNSLTYEETDIDSFDNISQALGARHFAHYDTEMYDANSVDMNLLRQMLDYKHELQQDPWSFVLDSDDLYNVRLARRDFIEKAPPNSEPENLADLDLRCSICDPFTVAVRVFPEEIVPNVGRIIVLSKEENKSIYELIKEQAAITHSCSKLNYSISIPYKECLVLYLRKLTEALDEQNLIIDPETNVVIKNPVVRSSLR